MRILAHVHTLNDEEVIERTIQSLVDQTYPIEDIIIVDNGSTDRTLEKTFAKQVTVIRHPTNRGTSGAVVTGFKYALDNGYDWIWVFDADSAPRRDALEKLMELYESLKPDVKARTWVLASVPTDDHATVPWYGVRFTRQGFEQVQPDPQQPFHEIDVTIWSGSLYKLTAVERVGLPSEDYVLNWGEYEYGYRGKQRGFQAFMHRGSILYHNTGGQPSVLFTTRRIGPFAIEMLDIAPIRLYYDARNIIYFWLYEYHGGKVYCFFHHSRWVLKHVIKLLPVTTNRGAALRAWVRGTWDGVARNLHHRY